MGEEAVCGATPVQIRRVDIVIAVCAIVWPEDWIEPPGCLKTGLHFARGDRPALSRIVTGSTATPVTTGSLKQPLACRYADAISLIGFQASRGIRGGQMFPGQEPIFSCNGKYPRQRRSDERAFV